MKEYQWMYGNLHIAYSNFLDLLTVYNSTCTFEVTFKTMNKIYYYELYIKSKISF